jgi:hypothetical protein
LRELGKVEGKDSIKTGKWKKSDVWQACFEGPGTTSQCVRWRPWAEGQIEDRDDGNVQNGI